MLTTTTNWLGRLGARLGQRRTLIALVLLEIAIMVTENTADFPLSVPYLRRTTGQTYLDMCAFCSDDAVYAVMDGLGERGRMLQALLMITVDVAIPGVSFLFGTALLGALLHDRPSGDRRRLLLVIPFVALLLDLAENASIIALLATYPRHVAWLATAEGLLSGAKFVAYGAMLVAVLGLALERGLRSRLAGARAGTE